MVSPIPIKGCLTPGFVPDCLKSKPNSKLELARNLSREDTAERSRLVSVQLREIEVRSVQQVEGLRFERNCSSFIYRKTPREGNVDCEESWATQDVASRIPE